MNDKRPAYSSSSYSGADIKVIATLSHEFLTKRKKELQKLRSEEEKLLKTINHEQMLFGMHDPNSTEEEDLFQELFSGAPFVGLLQQINDLELNIANATPGSPEHVQLLNQLVDLQEEYDQKLARLEDLKSIRVRAEQSKKTLDEQTPALRDLQYQIAEKSNLIMGSQVELGTVQTISCQSHRPKAAVRAIGSTYARGYTRGPRTIAGSMIFTVLNKQSLYHLCKAMGTMYGNQLNDPNPSTILPDQLLPIDLTFVMANEYGSVSRMALYGVEFLNSGYTFSIEDLLLEEVVQFIARDMDPMTDIYDSSHRKSRDSTLLDAPMTAKETLRGFLAARKRTKTRRNM